MKSFARLALISVATAGGLALSACLVDLSNLSGGTRDGGAAGGGGASGTTTTTTSASTTDATSAGTSAGGAAGTTASGSSGSGCTGAVLDCSGCACPAGGCDAVTLAMGSDADGPRGIAVADEGLFWSDKGGGRIMGILAQGSGPQLLVKGNGPSLLAVAAGRLVYSAIDGLWMCSLPSCDATKIHLANSIAPASIQSVAYDGGLIYWSDRGNDGNAGNGKVWRCDPQNKCASPYLIASQQLYPQGLFLTADSLFWIAQGNGQSNGSIHKSPRTGAGQTDIAAALVLPGGIVADDMYVYWTQATMGGAVLRCDYTQGYCMTPANVALKAGALNLPLDLALAGGRLYWNENGKGTISSCPLPGCAAAEAPRLHVSGRQGVRHLAVGSSCLFWNDDVNGGTVDKIGR